MSTLHCVGATYISTVIGLTMRYSFGQVYKNMLLLEDSVFKSQCSSKHHIIHSISIVLDGFMCRLRTVQMRVRRSCIMMKQAEQIQCCRQACIRKDMFIDGWHQACYARACSHESTTSSLPYQTSLLQSANVPLLLIL